MAVAESLRRMDTHSSHFVWRGTQGDNPYIAPGEFAKNNAVLVERMAGIARGLGREIGTPDEARKILGLTRAQ